MSKRWFFNLGAWGYDILTQQHLWRDQIAAMITYMEPRPEKITILDLGCGPGTSTFVLAERLGPNAKIIGIDIAERMIARARHHHKTTYRHLPNIEFQVADATKLSFAPATFDFATGHSFLYLVDDRLAVLREIKRVLRPGGAVILMEPNVRGNLPLAALSALGQADRLLTAPFATSKFCTCMVLWRLVSSTVGKMSHELVNELFTKAGFAQIECNPTLGGLGLHCVGRVV